LEQHIKHRLAGAVILVALAVIILPWLFSGNGEHSELDMPLDIPPAPEVSEVPVPEARDGEAPVEAPRPEPLPEPELPAEEELAAPRSDEPDETPAEPEAEEPPVSEPEPEPVPDVAEPEPEAAPEPEPEPEVTEEPRTTEEGLDIIPPAAATGWSRWAASATWKTPWASGTACVRTAWRCSPTGSIPRRAGRSTGYGWGRWRPARRRSGCWIAWRRSRGWRVWWLATRERRARFLQPLRFGNIHRLSAVRRGAVNELA